MAIAGIPALTTSMEDEERRGAPGAPVTPPTDPGGSGGTVGTVYPSDPIWRAEYSGTNPSWTPGDSNHGTKFTFVPGSWEMSQVELEAASGQNWPGANTANRREPTFNDQARLVFDNGTTLYAGRIDGSDRAEMNQDDDSYDGVRNGVGSGYANRPAMMNSLILTGVGLKDFAADPAVFPLGSPEFPDGAGPHRHSFAAQGNSYWTESTLRAGLGGLPAPGTDLNNDFLTQVVNRSASGFGFNTMMVPYWPTFVDGVLNNNSHSGYVGRPRGVAGIPNAQLPEYHGPLVPPPQGLRMVTFKAGVFKRAGASNWEFTFAFPCCWDGEHEWLPGGAHMEFLDPDTGQPPSSHPFVIPFIHWFVTTNIPSSLNASQAFVRQSAQVTDPNPAAIYFGERRDFWNYSNDYVEPHMEILLAWDPVFAEAVTWMVNNYCGLGRVNQRGDVGNV